MSLAKHDNYMKYSKYLREKTGFFLIAGFVGNNKGAGRYEKAEMRNTDEEIEK